MYKEPQEYYRTLQDMDASRPVLVVRKKITALRIKLLEFDQTRNNDVLKNILKLLDYFHTLQ